MKHTCKQCNSELSDSILKPIYKKFAISISFRAESATLICENCNTKLVLTEDSLKKAAVKDKIDSFTIMATVFYAYLVVRNKDMLMGMGLNLTLLVPLILFLYIRTYYKAKKHFEFDIHD